MIEKIDTAVLYSLGALAILTATFFLGYTCSANKYKLEIEQIKSTALAEQAKALEDKNTKEKNSYEIIVQSQSNLLSKTDDIQKSYSLLSNTDLFKSNDSVLNTDNTSSNTDLSDSANSTERVQSCNCQCPRDYRTRLQRLYRQQLEVARDCDITATHYNELIDIYKGVQ